MESKNAHTHLQNIVSQSGRITWNADKKSHAARKRTKFKNEEREKTKYKHKGTCVTIYTEFGSYGVSVYVKSN